MKWIGQLGNSFITFLSSLIVLSFLPRIQSIMHNIATFLSIDEEYFTRVDTFTIAFLVSVTSYFALFISTSLGKMLVVFKDLCRKVRINIEFLNQRDKPILELKFKKMDKINFESQLIKVKFNLQLPIIALKIVRLLGGRLRVSFNPNLINCELDNGFLERNTNINSCYKEGKDIYINLSPLYEPSEEPIGNSVNLIIQPLQQSTARIVIDIVPKKNKRELGIIRYFFSYSLLKVMVKIEQQKIILKS